MAHLLNLESITLTHAARTLLDHLSLGLDDGDRIGIVGRNGDGKSTLLRIIARLQEPDSGRVTHARGVRVAMLAQTDDFAPAASVRQVIVGDVDDHVWAADARIRDVFVGLLGGVAAPFVGGLDVPVDRLSGGQRRRVALAALLADEQEVLLLDEPTNHLDVEGVAWLAEHLRSRWSPGRGALALVTHDRWFLDAVALSTWEVHDGVIDTYEGGYAAYVLARAERSRISAVTEERRRNLLRKELAWLRRGAPARTSKPKFRLDAAASLIADEPPPRDAFALQKMATARLGKDVLDLEDVSVVVGHGLSQKVLLSGVTWRLAPGERVGVVGVNGSGKTTLLRTLLGEVAPTSGRLRRGKTVRTAILSQDVAELDEVADLRVQEAAEGVRGTIMIEGKEVTAGQMLERLGFARERMWTVVSELSGGERRRLQLLRLLMGEPNVLMLDEPTNDLDTDTLAAVEDALDGWPGTLVVVSHDRYLLERVCDRQVALLGDGKVRDLPGGVEEYLRLRASILAADGPAAGLAEASTSAVPDRAAFSASSAAELRAARKEMTRIERQLEKLQAEETRVHEQMVARATEHEAVLSLDTRLRELAGEREVLEEQWLLMSEAT